MVAEHAADGAGLRDVAEWSGGSVRIDVLHLVGCDPGAAQRPGHRERGSRPILRRGGDVVRVGAHPDPQHLREDRCVPGGGALQRFQDQDPRPLTMHEAAPRLSNGMEADCGDG
jgi:hypothetical protein